VTAKKVEKEEEETVKIPRLIVAGNFNEFRWFLRENGLSTVNHKYVSQAEQLHGIATNTEIALVGTYKNRDDWEQIKGRITAKDGLKAKVFKDGN